MLIRVSHNVKLLVARMAAERGITVSDLVRGAVARRRGEGGRGVLSSSQLAPIPEVPNHPTGDSTAI